METIARLRGDDLEQMFADWGQPVVLRRVTQTPSPATGDVAEVGDDVVVAAVVRQLDQRPTASTASQHATREREFVVRATELPEAWSWSASRIVHEGREHSVLGASVSSDGAVVVVRGQYV